MRLGDVGDAERSSTSSVTPSAMRAAAPPCRRRASTFSRDRQAVEHAGHLGLDADAEAGDGVGGAAGDRRSPRNSTSPPVGLQLAGQALEEGALAGAVGADQAAQLALAAGVKSTRSTATTPPKRMVRSAGLEQRRVHRSEARSLGCGAAAGGRTARPFSRARRRPPAPSGPWAPASTKITSRTPSTRLGSTQPKPLSWLSVPS